MPQVTGVVLAGGFGTRIRHLLPGIPKPMAPVLGRPFLEWIVRYLAKQGISKVVLSTGYLADRIDAHFSKLRVPGIETKCVQETEPLGTAGGFLNSVTGSGLSSEYWLVLNGDSLCFSNLSDDLAAIVRDQSVARLLGVEMDDAARYGTLSIGPAGALQGFAEKKPGKGVINAGIYLFHDSALRHFPKNRPLSFELDVFPCLLSRDLKLAVGISRGPFLDIGTPESLGKAEAFISANLHHFL